MPVAGLTSSLTSLIGNHGIYAVFGLMAVDAVLPAASELVMVYAGALAAGAFAGQHVDLFGARISSHGWGFVAMALAGTLGYLLGGIAGWATDRASTQVSERASAIASSSAAERLRALVASTTTTSVTNPAARN